MELDGPDLLFPEDTPMEAGVRWTREMFGLRAAEIALILGHDKTPLPKLRAFSSGNGQEYLLFQNCYHMTIWYQQEITRLMLPKFGIEVEWVVQTESGGAFTTHKDFYRELFMRIQPYIAGESMTG